MLDNTTFDSIFRKLYRPLLIYAQQFLEAEDDAMDVVSDAFSDVWEKKSSMNEDTIKSYLYTLVRNKCIDLLRHRNHEKNYVLFILNNVTEISDEASAIEEQERNEIVSQQLAKLSPQMRQMMHHKVVDSMRYQEIADKMGVTLNVVKKQMAKAFSIIKLVN